MAAIAASHYSLLAGAAACVSSASFLSKNVASSSNAATASLSLSLRRLPRWHSGARSIQRRRRAFKSPSALFDRGTGGSDNNKKSDKKFITKDQEPEQYWQSNDEKTGKNPMSTPLPYIAILSVLSPFIILAVAFFNDWIKIPVR